MARTPNLDMPEIEHGEVNGDVTHNEGLQIIDLHGQSIIEGLQQNQPGSPAEGQAWIIYGGAPTGTDWSVNGSENDVAHYYSGVWHYYTPQQGWAFYAKSDTLIWQFTGITWQIYIAGDNPPNQTWQAFQDYDTPLTTPSLTAGSFSDIVIPTSAQIGTEFSYNNTTGDLTYTGVQAVVDCSFTIQLGNTANGQNYAMRIYDSTNIESIVIAGVYVTSNAISSVSLSGSLLYTLNTNDVIKLQLNPSNTSTFDIAGGWFIHKMYNV